MHVELSRLLKQTSDFLADITHYPSVVLGPGLRGHTIRDLHLIPVEPGVVLMVVVTDGGRVNQSIIRLSRPITPAEVDEAQEVLGSMLSGTAVDDADTLGESAETSLPEMAAEVVDRALVRVEELSHATREIYLGGQSHMVELWEDLAKLHRILAIMEREATLLDLVEDPEGGGTTVRLGREVHAAEEDLAVVSTKYGDEDTGGRVGVLGPMRMDYKRAIRVVEEVGEALGDSVSGS